MKRIYLVFSTSLLNHFCNAELKVTLFQYVMNKDSCYDKFKSFLLNIISCLKYSMFN